MRRRVLITLLGSGIAALAAEDPVDPELAALRERLMQMAVRAGVIRTSLQNLKQQLATSGLGLRTDMVEAEQRLVMLMDTAQAALDRGSATDAKTNLDGAELSLVKLEKFLGR
jgi:hypothetical protein